MKVYTLRNAGISESWYVHPVSCVFITIMLSDFTQFSLYSVAVSFQCSSATGGLEDVPEGVTLAASSLCSPCHELILLCLYSE